MRLIVVLVGLSGCVTNADDATSDPPTVPTPERVTIETVACDTPSTAVARGISVDEDNGHYVPTLISIHTGDVLTYAVFAAPGHVANDGASTDYGLNVDTHAVFPVCLKFTEPGIFGYHHRTILAEFDGTVAVTERGAE